MTTSSKRDEPAPRSSTMPSLGPPDFAVRLRPDRSIAFINEALCLLHSVTAEEVLGQPFVVLIDPADRPSMQADLARLSAEHRAVVSEARARPGGAGAPRVRWTHLVVVDAAGELVEIHSFGRDVTKEQKNEEDAARLAAIVAGAEDAVVGKTLEGIVTSWNPGAESMFGFTAAEVVGRSIALIIPRERLHEETEILARLQRGEKTEHFQTERLHKDGRLLAVSVNVSPIHGSGGRIIGASKIVRDITEQRRAQNQLQTSLLTLEALYRLVDLVGQAKSRAEVCEAALDAITAALGTERASVLIFDSLGVMRFTAWRGLSDHYREVMDGHSPWRRESKNPPPILVEDVLSDPSMDALRDEITREGIRSLAFIPLVYQTHLLGKFMVYFDRPRRFTNEEYRLAETIGRHVGFGLARVDAEATAAAALGRERAARQEADDARGEAELASRAKDEFLAMLAHELRNPLAVIVHCSAILGAERATPAEFGNAASMIERQAAHLARLLDDLLDVARITSGHIQLDTQPVDLNTVVSLALEAPRIRINAKEQRLAVSLPSPPLTVMGDAVRLQQVVGNLVNNASKYTPSGGSIQVVLDVDAGDALLEVRDTGAGIQPDRLDAIFDLFVQADPTLARTEGGLGIGLTLVRRVIERHAGRVEGRSEGPGKGAEFSVRLPLAKGPTGEARPAPVSPPVPVARRRVLLVEDHADGSEALATLLRLHGHDVFEAATGQEALAQAADHVPDVVLLDIGLPDQDGYEVGRALRRTLGNRVHLVALTGYGQPADRERAREAGFEAHLVKPVESRAILEAIASLVP